MTLRERPATAPPSSTAAWFRPDVQGWRGIAVLIVITYHAGFGLPGGFISVDTFFVISGFVITSLIFREWDKTGRFSYRRFYDHRIRRLLPAVSVVVVFTLVFTFFFQSPFGAQQTSALTAAGSLLMVANFVILRQSGDYFAPAADNNALLQTWSLSVEEQFYLVMPLILVAGLLWARRRSSGISFPVGALILVVALVSFAANVLLSFHLLPVSNAGTQELLAFYSPITRGWEFLAGAALALPWVIAQGRHRFGWLFAWSGVGLMVYGYLVIAPEDAFPGFWALVPVVGMMLVITFGPCSPLLCRCLTVRPLRALGDWSYALYLWHWPLLLLAIAVIPGWWGKVLSLIVAIVLSWATTRFVEMPLRTRKIPEKTARPLLVVLFVVPLVMAALVVIGANRAWGNESLVKFRDQVMPEHAALTLNCDAAPKDPVAESRCRLVDGTGDPIYLIGDSQAAQLSGALVGVGARENRPVQAAILGRCAPLLRDDGALPDPVDGCSEFTGALYPWLEGREPGTVLLAFSNPVGTEGDATIPTYREYEARLTASIESLQRAGHEVVLLEPLPFLRYAEGSGPRAGDFWRPSDCMDSGISFDPAQCGMSVPRDEVLASQESLRRANSEVASSTGARSIDLMPFVCSESECATNRGSTWIFRDGAHISVPMSAEISEDLGLLLVQ